MKVGTSYSRCVRDLVDGKVDYNDVMVIVTRTDFDPEDDAQWTGIWRGYAGDGVGGLWSNPEWINHQEQEAEFREMSIRLKRDGKLHQPRQFGAYPLRTQHEWYDLVLTAELHESNPAARNAWERYKTVAGLVANQEEKNA
jgi:hypothetical protein